MKNSAPALAFLLFSALAAGAVAQPAPKPAPKLVVAISVDQFSADLFAEYRQYFVGGLRRLSREGVVFPSGYQSHAATETCPGHSTILTGAHPDRTGIIANNWFNLRLKKDKIYCAEDESQSTYTISAAHLKVPTLGKRMKVDNSAVRSVVVAGKDRAAVMLGGDKVDQIWWWKDKAFMGPAGQTSAAADRINKAVAEELATPRSGSALPEICEARNHAVTVGGTKTVGINHFERNAGENGLFRASPDFDRAILALAAAVAAEMKLDEGNATNLLAIGLSATDYVGHTYGTEGAEMCLQLLSLDRELGFFFDKLDATGVDYVVVLTADHGGHDLPERNEEHAATAAVRVDPHLVASPMSQTIAQVLTLKDPVLYGEGASGDIYVDNNLTASQKADVLDRAKKLYEASPQVARVLTHAELQARPRPTGSPDTWSLEDRARASFDPERSGDLVVLLKPQVTPITEERAKLEGEYVATHGSPWDYDRRVPILFWRRGITPFEQPLPVETVDIAPTLAALISLKVEPGAFDGKCLDLDAGLESTCK
ncbi:MAG: alkaline phosphatase family protein [Acidobacteriota bacterium]